MNDRKVTIAGTSGQSDKPSVRNFFSKQASQRHAQMHDGCTPPAKFTMHFRARRCSARLLRGDLSRAAKSEGKSKGSIARAEMDRGDKSGGVCSR
jgi:hypothetical protein